ncbi:SulP family inorganic anion transporter [Thalassospira sp.]|uniref:SulP family inorganic anion transporter n=1 Tax=Thalassospira sp. TaxID=1912094 RepID=UPI002736CEC9|nr:sulfate permease [Thalassospira sp.]MDP2697680.1 sulfate permease [Thalassospira sp.]
MLRRFFPVFDWGREYSRANAFSDLSAAVIVTVMLIPQSLAYAMLAGLPPEVGLYASILPLVAYAVFGTSRVLAVGPVAVVSLMTASTIGAASLPDGVSVITAAVTLAVMSGVMLLVMGIFRLGFLASFLSHPVISGFITASAILIAVSQLKHILGIEIAGETLPESVVALIGGIGNVHVPTMIIGAGCLAFLFWARCRLKSTLKRLGIGDGIAGFLTKAGPVLAVIVSIVAVWAMDLAPGGVRIVGDIPQGLPGLSLPSFDLGLIGQFAVPALLISMIGFVESVSVAQTLAAKRRQRIVPDQELVALGASNLVAGFSGGYPVTGGFARSVVNYDAGAQTPAAGAFTAIGIGVATLYLTPYLYFLPQATLAATIIVAVLSLVDIGVIKRTWAYSRSDFSALLTTIVVTLIFGVEPGVISGVVLSLALYLHRTSRPHIAVVGLLPGSEHFRNVLRHPVATGKRVLSIRLDESLYFANCRFLEDRIYALVAQNREVRDVVLMCPAVNEIDASGLESLEEINHRLKDSGVRFHLSEVKGPVMDRLQKSSFPDHLNGRIFLSHYAALAELDPELVAQSDGGAVA